MNRDEMKTRTQKFAKRVVKLCRELPDNSEGRLIGNQMFRSGTPVAANYRAACRVKSTADFIANLSIVEEEADETLFWLELISDLEIVNKNLLVSLMKGSGEIIAIVVSSIRTARSIK